jgi:hypothetical protein
MLAIKPKLLMELLVLKCGFSKARLWSMIQPPEIDDNKSFKTAVAHVHNVVIDKGKINAATKA